MASKEKYAVVRVYKNSNRRKILARNLPIEKAQAMADSLQSTKDSMVVFYNMDNISGIGSINNSGSSSNNGSTGNSNKCLG